MRKIISFSMMLLVITSFIFLSCSKDDEPVNIPPSISLNVGSSYDLGIKGDWSSSNEFVASVSDKGVIYGEHVGECIATIGIKRCKVSIEGIINLYKDPILEWGISKSEVISKCGNNYMETDNGKAIGYNTGNPKAPILMYTFENGKLSNAVMTVSTDYTSTLLDFLLERYLMIGMYDYDFFFINNGTFQTSTTVIGVTLFNVNYWEVIYMPKTFIKSSKIENLNIERDLNMLIYQLDK